MAQHYHFKDNGDQVLPITEGATFYTESMSADYQNGYCYIDFFSDEAGETRADAGAIVATFESKPTPTGRPEQWHQSPDGTVTASSAFDGSYTPIGFEGAATQSRVTFTNVTGTFYARAWHWRS